MNIEYQSNTQIEVKLPNGNTITLLYRPTTDELTTVFGGEGYRNIKEVQHRVDGYSSCSFTKQE